MTDVVIQNMATGACTTLACRAAVRKIAVYERRLAVQLQDSVLVYSLPAGAVHALLYGQGHS